MRSNHYFALGALVLVLALVALIQLGVLLQRPEWITAVATIVLAIAAVLAILREQVQRWLFHPDLVIRPDLYHRTTRIERDYGIGVKYWAKTYYVVFVVENVGRASARNVEVAVISVVRRDLESGPQKHQMLTPFGLKWAYLENPTMPLIPVDSSRPMALGHITDPAKGGDVGESATPAKRSYFWLELFVRPNSLEGRLEPGEYDIDVRITADNAASKVFSFSLRHSGNWPTDIREIWPGELKVTLLGSKAVQP